MINWEFKFVDIPKLYRMSNQLNMFSHQKPTDELKSVIRTLKLQRGVTLSASTASALAAFSVTYYMWKVV